MLSQRKLCEKPGYSHASKEDNHHISQRWHIHQMQVGPGVAVGTSPRSDADAASRDRPPTASGDREPFAEGLVERESGSSGSAGETIPKTPVSQIPARPLNTSGGKHQASTIQLTNRETYFLGCALNAGRDWRGDHARQLKFKNIKNHTRHAMCIASLSSDGSSCCRHRVSVAVQILLFSQPFLRIKTLPESWLPRERFGDLAEVRWLNQISNQGAPERTTSNMCEEHTEGCKVGAEDWLVQNVGRSKDSTIGNCQIGQTAVFMPYHPTKVMMTTSIVEPSLIEPTCVTKCPEQVHHSQHNHGRKDQFDHGKVVGNIVGGSVPKFLGSNRASTLMERCTTSKSQQSKSLSVDFVS